jgi:ribosomal-protein-alanine acetyltransferase
VTAELRRATAADLDVIVELENASFPVDAWSADMLRSELASPHTYYLIAEDGSEVLGYAGLLAPGGSGAGDIQTIAVAEAARRRGVGRGLMNALIAEARSRGAADVFLEVRADNPAAQDLYRSLGFAVIGRRAAYYQPEGIDALVMRLSLASEAAS